MRSDLQYDLCPGCGEIAPKGLIPSIMHSCPLNQVTIYYNSTGFSLRQFRSIFDRKDELASFRELPNSEYFKEMPDFETASEIDKIIYSICRDADIKAMKRMRAYIELEERFNASY